MTNTSWVVVRPCFRQVSAHVLAQNAVCSRSGKPPAHRCRPPASANPLLRSLLPAVIEVALRRAVVATTDTAFSHKLDTDWAVTDQKSSGRCWLFAVLNLLRVDTMRQLNVKSFEFSQNYLVLSCLL